MNLKKFQERQRGGGNCDFRNAIHWKTRGRSLKGELSGAINSRVQREIKEGKTYCKNEKDRNAEVSVMKKGNSSEANETQRGKVRMESATCGSGSGMTNVAAKRIQT